MDCIVHGVAELDTTERLSLLENEMATHSSILAWRIPWTEEPGRLQSTGSQRVRQNWATKHSTGTTHILVWKLSSGEKRYHYMHIFLWLNDSEVKVALVSGSLRPHGLYSPWNSPGQNTGVGSLSLLQGIFPIQGWNPGLLHCRHSVYQLNHKGSPQWLYLVGNPPTNSTLRSAEDLTGGLGHLATEFHYRFVISTGKRRVILPSLKTVTSYTEKIQSLNFQK